MTDFITDMIADSGNPFKQAALAVQEALRDNTGRRKNLNHWRGVAREALGKQRMSTKQWEKVLRAGYDAGLFTLDEKTLSFPILVLSEPSEPEPQVEVTPSPPLVEEILEEEEEPKGPFDPPVHLDCGHWNKQVIPKTPEECTPEEKARLHDERVVKPYKTVKVEHPDDCIHCRLGKRVDHQFQKGKYRTPVPESQRRSQEREDKEGWPGLCTDPATGFYIGGLGNDCRRYHDGPERCVVHTTPEPQPTQKRKVTKTRRKEKSA